MRAAARERRARGLHDVAGLRGVVRRVEVAVALQVRPRVACAARVAARRLAQPRTRRDIRRDGVVIGHELGAEALPEVVVAVVARRRVGEHEHALRLARQRRELHAREDRRAPRVGDPRLLEHPARGRASSAGTSSPPSGLTCARTPGPVSRSTCVPSLTTNSSERRLGVPRSGK